MRHPTIGPALSIALLVSIAACEPDAVTDPVEPTEEGAQSADDSIPDVLQTAVQTPEGCHVVSYEVRNELGYFEGDIILGPAEELSAITECPATGKNPKGAEPKTAQNRQRGAIRVIAQKWPNGVVRFETPTFWASQIKRAIALWDASPDVTFFEVPAGTPAPRIRFVIDPFNPFGGSSDIGMQGSFIVPQEIKLGPFTMGDVGLIAHEIGHALGMPHEQTRADRDTHVVINWLCIQSGKGHNFEKSIWNMGLTAYDYSSIMHYSADQFSRFSGCNTIIAKNGNTINPSTIPTSNDLAAINVWY